jgi:early secretory antigenic target protein ESAT-6
MANDGLLRVNFIELGQATADIQAAISALQNDLDELETQGGRLAEGWEGAAKQAYVDRQTAWRDASRSLQEILIGIRGAVEKSTDDYQSTEHQATQRFL